MPNLTKIRITWELHIIIQSISLNLNNARPNLTKVIITWESHIIIQSIVIGKAHNRNGQRKDTHQITLAINYPYINLHSASLFPQLYSTPLNLQQQNMERTSTPSSFIYEHV